MNPLTPDEPTEPPASLSVLDGPGGRIAPAHFPAYAPSPPPPALYADLPVPPRWLGHRPAAPAPADLVEFASPDGVRRMVGVLLAAAAVTTGVASYAAYLDPTASSIGLAATLGALTAVLFAGRAGSRATRVTVLGGEVTIDRGGSRYRFDLAGDYTPVEVVGEPGRRGWQVLFHRRSMTPYVIDASMVDPVRFMRVLRSYRPE